MAKKNNVLEEQHCSSYDKRQLCAYDVEFIGSPTKPLIHQSARFWLFTQGKATLNIDGNDYKIIPNTFVAILPWQTTDITDVEEPIRLIKIIYNYDVISKNIRSDLNSNNRFIEISNPIETNPVLLLSDEELRIITSITEVIQRELGIESIYDRAEEQELSSLLVVNKLCELAIYFNRYAKKKNCINIDGESMELDERPAIFRYIYSHLADHLSTAKIASVFNMSEDAVNRYIQDVTGLTPIALALEMRLSKTSDLLVYSDLALTDIAFLVGYNDASHLIRDFVERNGITPSDYRDAYQDKGAFFKEKSQSISYQIVSYIHEHFSEDIKVADVAQHFHMSVVELNRTLLFVIEKNFEEFINYLRINKACELLLTSEDALVDISTAVGYNTVKTFSRHFLKIKNMTPGDFRKNIILQKDSETIFK